MARRLSRVRRGLDHAALGVRVLEAWRRIERRLLGRDPVYDRSRMAAALAERMGWTLSAEQADLLGRVLQIGYAAGWGLLFIALPRRVRRSPLAPFALAAAILGFELWLFPRLRLTEPPFAWSREELALLGAHTLTFGVSTGRA